MVPKDRSVRADTELDLPALASTQPGSPSPGATTFIGSDTSTIDRNEYPLEPGTTLGEYVIESMIGEGAMGTVFAAVHPVIHKKAAIKVLKRQFCADQTMVERFMDEARVVNQIGHPNIVDVFAFGEMPDGRFYFVMEWLKGETLRDRTKRKPLSLAEAAAVVRSLARALEAAHQKGVIHRDLKPDNVVLANVDDDSPTVKLLDFGVAKLLANDSEHEHGIIGTPLYMAPEQAMKAATVGPEADVYALGAIAFELLTARPPFIGTSVIEIITQHATEPPETPSSIISTIPEELDAIVLAMLAKDPAERPSLKAVRAVMSRVKDPDEAPDAPRITARRTPAIGVTIRQPRLATEPMPAVPKPGAQPSEQMAAVKPVRQSGALDPVVVVQPERKKATRPLFLVALLVVVIIAFAFTVLSD